MIVSAAIKYQLYPHDDTGGEVILPLHRHGDGGIILKALGFEPGALFHAIECGQLEEDPEDLAAITSGVLMSEDLW